MASSSQVGANLLQWPHLKQKRSIYKYDGLCLKIYQLSVAQHWARRQVEMSDGITLACILALQ
jgi:hypothetical protein